MTLCRHLYALLLLLLLAIGVSVSAAPVNWTARTAAQDNTIASICWSPALHLFCAVSSDGSQRVQTSPDGITWTGRTAAEANGWIAVCWSPELAIFCAVAGDGTHQVMTSPDGITWTARTAAASTVWRNVVWAKELGIFCAVAAFGATDVMTSPDGITWTPHTAATTGLIGLCWAPELGLFVAGGGADAHRLMTSPDGATWTDRTAATPEDWLSIAWSPALSLLVAVGDTSNTGFNRRVMTSPDGINWTSRIPPEANDYSSVCWSPELGLFLAVSNNGTNRSMISADGITWTMLATAAQNFWYTVCWSADLRRFAAGSWDGAQRFMTGNVRTFYVDHAGGSDSNNGTNPSQAWQRHPYMNGFAGSYTHSSGDRFFFKGGVTWPVTCFQMGVVAGGSSSARDYYGADVSWYTGGTFARPLFDFQDTLINNAGFWQGSGVRVTASYIDWDNIELARHRAPLVNSPGTNSFGCVSLLLDGAVNEFTITNCVVRDWSIPTPVPAGGDNGGGGGVHYINSGGQTNLLVTHCLLYQQAAGVQSGAAVNLYGTIEYTTIHDTPNGFLGGGVVRFNEFYNITTPNDSLSHPNAMETFAPTTTYGNLIHDLSVGAAAIYQLPDWSGGSGVDLIYNNIVWNPGNQAAVQIDTGGVPINSGARVFNNILVHPSVCIRVVERGDGPYGVLDVQNNQLITSGTPVCYDNPGGGCADVVDFTYLSNVVQTASQAAGLGFTASRYYQPTIAVPGTGEDLSAYFTTSLNGARSVPWSVGAYQNLTFRLLRVRNMRTGRIAAPP